MESFSKFGIDGSCTVNVTGDVNLREINRICSIIPVGSLNGCLVLWSFEVEPVRAVDSDVWLLGYQRRLVD